MQNSTEKTVIMLGIDPEDFESMEQAVMARAVRDHHYNAKPLTESQEAIIRKWWRHPGVNKEEIARIMGLCYETVKKHAKRMGV